MARGKNKVNYLGREGLVSTTGESPDWSFLYEASKIKHPNYNIGDRVVLPDGRVFRYAKCASSFTDMKSAVSQYSPLAMVKTAAINATLAGAKSITLTVSATTHGVARGGVIAEDELRGGYIHIYNSTTVRDNRGIVGNTALAADGITFTIYLDAPISVAFSGTTSCEILPNPYSALKQDTSHSVRFMGMPMAKATTGQYFWLQTWGIVRITPCRGATFTERFSLDAECFFGYNGGLLFQQEVIDLPSGEKTYGYQRAGFVVESPRLGSDTPGPFLMLQISP